MSPCVSPLMLALSPLEAFSMPAGMPMLPPLQPLQPLHSVAATLEASSALGIALAALQSGGEGGSSFRFFPVGSPPHPKPPAPRDWQEPLQELKAAPTITLGTSVELCAFKEFVRGRIAEALSAARASTEWRESGLPTYLSKALALVDEDCTLLARQQAVELLGFVALAHSSRATTSSAASTGAASTTSGPSPSSTNVVFKVPAPVRGEKQPADIKAAAAAVAAAAAGPDRRHNAPKRRPTPQVLGDPPASMCCKQPSCSLSDLSAWCSHCSSSGGQQPSSKRARVSPPAQAEGGSPPHSSGCSTQGSSNEALPKQKQQQQEGGAPSASHLSTSSGGSSGGAPPQGQGFHGMLCKPPSRKHADAIAAVKVAFHRHPADAQPAAEALVLSKERQMPMTTWEGPIKHRQGSAVVELCSVGLQVPELFAEQFPRSLFALEICHRRQVSLGDHVVCRASLGPLNERQLSGLTAMARNQLVLVAALQTAELHLVPYFDNKNMVRLVGFLRVHQA